MLSGGRIIDIIPAESMVFKAPDYYIANEVNKHTKFISKGCTRWPVMILYFGPHFEISKKKNVKKFCGSDKTTYKRVKVIVQRNFIFSDNASHNEEMINFALNKLDY